MGLGAGEGLGVGEGAGVGVTTAAGVEEGARLWGVGLAAGGVEAGIGEPAGRLGATTDDATQTTCGESRNDQCKEVAAKRTSTNLSGVQIITISIELRIVEVEDGGIDTVVACNTFACVPRLNHVSLSTVFTLSPKAKLLAGNEVRALCVNFVDVDHS